MTARGEIPEPERRRLHAALDGRAAADAEYVAAIHAAKAAGGSVRVIAAEVGASTRTVGKILKSE